MSARYFTYTRPGFIEGESDEVVDIAKQQIRALAAVVAELSGDTAKQLLAAGINPDAENAVEAWASTEDGAAARDLILSARHFAEAARAL